MQESLWRGSLGLLSVTSGVSSIGSANVVMGGGHEGDTGEKMSGVEPCDEFTMNSEDNQAVSPTREDSKQPLPLSKTNLSKTEGSSILGQALSILATTPHISPPCEGSPSSPAGFAATPPCTPVSSLP